MERVCKDNLPPIYKKDVKKIIIYHQFQEVKAPDNPITSGMIEAGMKERADWLKKCLKNVDSEVEILHEPSDEIFNSDNLIYIVQTVISNNADLSIPQKYLISIKISKYRADLTNEENLELQKEVVFNSRHFSDENSHIAVGSIMASFDAFSLGSIMEDKISEGGFNPN